MTYCRLFSILFIVGAVLFCTVRIHAQTAGGTSQVSPVANLQGSNASVVNNNFQYLQNGVNAALYEIQQYFPGGILQTDMGGTGANLSAATTGDSLVIASNGTIAAGILPWVPTNIQVFTSSGTWTKPAGVSTVYVKVIGDGGGGAPTAHTPSGGGGGAGGYSEGFVTVSGNVTVTIGTGGAGGTSGGSGGSGSGSSFAASGGTISASGGSGGAGGTSSTVGGGGSGGVGSGGQINMYGLPGLQGLLAGSSIYAGGPGGTVLGQSTYGSGGSGTASNNTGGSGSSGAVIVYY